MSEITVVVLRYGLFALLWLFVYLVANVLRKDLFGMRAPRAKSRRRKASPTPAAQPQAASATAHTLHLTSGAQAGTTVALGTSPITIGRAADCTVVITDDYASSQHARLFPTPQGWVIEDLNSTNGTYLDGERLTTPTVMTPGTAVTIGQATLEVRS